MLRRKDERVPGRPPALDLAVITAAALPCIGEADHGPAVPSDDVLEQRRAVSAPESDLPVVSGACKPPVSEHRKGEHNGWESVTRL